MSVVMTPEISEHSQNPRQFVRVAEEDAQHLVSTLLNLQAHATAQLLEAAARASVEGVDDKSAVFSDVLPSRLPASCVKIFAVRKSSSNFFMRLSFSASVLARLTSRR